VRKCKSRSEWTPLPLNRRGRTGREGRGRGKCWKRSVGNRKKNRNSINFRGGRDEQGGICKASRTRPLKGPIRNGQGVSSGLVTSNHQGNHVKGKKRTRGPVLGVPSVFRNGDVTRHRTQLPRREVCPPAGEHGQNNFRGDKRRRERQWEGSAGSDERGHRGSKEGENKNISVAGTGYPSPCTTFGNWHHKKE